MAKSQKKQGGSAVQEPTPPFAKKHLEKPGLESELEPRPRFQAPQYRAAGKLEGKVALVTGGDSGIGRAVAVLYAREGADVAVTHLAQEKTDAAETKRQIESHGRRVLLLEGDLTEPEFCRAVVEETVAKLGRLDIVVNNAAYQQSQETLEDLSDEQWDHTFRTNAYACFRVTKAALPHLTRGAAIINTSSITALRGSPDLLDYSATKGAILSFTKALARTLVDRGIRVNCVAPGPVWTPLNPSDAPAEEAAQFGEDTPMGRPAQPEEIAPAYVYFASEADSSYVTGEVITLLGGETIGG
jgi:NAD(P)-dependent dehydrogenase (short-subunit alcohol dehydrogenase family)